MTRTFTWAARSVSLSQNHTIYSDGTTRRRSYRCAGAMLKNLSPYAIEVVSASAYRSFPVNAPSLGEKLAYPAVFARISDASGGMECTALKADSASADLPSQVVMRRRAASCTTTATIRRVKPHDARTTRAFVAGEGMHLRFMPPYLNDLGNWDATPLRLAQGEGLSLMPTPMATSGVDPSFPWGSVDAQVTVRNPSTGATYSWFCEDLVCAPGGLCMFSLMNGSGSGINLDVIGVSVVWNTSYWKVNAVLRQTSVCLYRTPAPDLIAFDAAIEYTTDITAADTEKPLPSGITAWVGKLPLDDGSIGKVVTTGVVGSYSSDLEHAMAMRGHGVSGTSAREWFAGDLKRNTIVDRVQNMPPSTAPFPGHVQAHKLLTDRSGIRWVVKSGDALMFASRPHGLLGAADIGDCHAADIDCVFDYEVTFNVVTDLGVRQARAIGAQNVRGSNLP